MGTTDGGGLARRARQLAPIAALAGATAAGAAAAYRRRRRSSAMSPDASLAGPPTARPAPQVEALVAALSPALEPSSDVHPVATAEPTAGRPALIRRGTSESRAAFAGPADPPADVGLDPTSASTPTRAPAPIAGPADADALVAASPGRERPVAMVAPPVDAVALVDAGAPATNGALDLAPPVADGAPVETAAPGGNGAAPAPPAPGPEASPAPPVAAAAPATATPAPPAPARPTPATPSPPVAAAPTATPAPVPDLSPTRPAPPTPPTPPVAPAPAPDRAPAPPPAVPEPQGAAGRPPAGFVARQLTAVRRHRVRLVAGLVVVGLGVGASAALAGVERDEPRAETAGSSADEDTPSTRPPETTTTTARRVPVDQAFSTAAARLTEAGTFGYRGDVRATDVSAVRPMMWLAVESAVRGEVDLATGRIHELAVADDGRASETIAEGETVWGRRADDATAVADEPYGLVPELSRPTEGTPARGLVLLPVWLAGATSPTQVVTEPGSDRWFQATIPAEVFGAVERGRPSEDVVVLLAVDDDGAPTRVTLTTAASDHLHVEIELTDVGRPVAIVPPGPPAD